MSKDKTYILRRPIKAKRMNSENWRDIFEVDMPASWDAEQSITYELQEDDFNKTFVELDVAGLTRQVEESLTFLCQYAYDAGYTTGDDRTVTGKDVDLSVKTTALKIVGLLLNQEGETK